MSDQETTTQQTSAEGTQASTSETKKRTFIEEMEVTGNNLVERIKDLVQDSSTRRVVIKTQEGNELLTVPLTMGVVAGGLVAWAAPMLAAIGAVAGLVTRVKLEVVREEDGDDSPTT